MCNCKRQFMQLRELSNQLANTPGDGSILQNLTSESEKEKKKAIKILLAKQGADEESVLEEEGFRCTDCLKA